MIASSMSSVVEMSQAPAAAVAPNSVPVTASTHVFYPHTTRSRPGVVRAGAPRVHAPNDGPHAHVVTHLMALWSDPALPHLGTAAQRSMAQRLLDDGWRVLAEVPVPGLGRDGWMDLFAVKDGIRVAIEIDRGRPKASSLQKLAAWNAEIKLACYLLDSPLATDIPDGVLAMWLPSRPNTTEENAFKGWPRNMRVKPEHCIGA